MKKYTLVIAEKPEVAKRIATAIDINKKPEKIVNHSVPYYEAHRNGNIVVVPALGHLYTVASKGKTRGSYPVFDYQWVPRCQAERKSSRIRLWLKVITSLAENADAFIDACDFDIEGSIIGYTILKYACGEKHEIAKRMKFSTLTEEELKQSYDHPLPSLDFALVEAGLTRHEVDWLYGINLSRALALAAKRATGQYSNLSTGRVQGPTLKFLAAREEAIKCFVPTPFWTITATIAIDDSVFEVEYERKLERESEAKAIRDACKTSEGTIKKLFFKDFRENPPHPFDLGTLQSEAYHIFKYSPIRTSHGAQHLYTDALISYPRTNSQKLPPEICYQSILKKLSEAPAYARQATELLGKPNLKPHEGKGDDLAHPAIYPTGNLPKKPLGRLERNVFDLIVRRFLAAFAEPALRKSVNATIELNGNDFHLERTQTLLEGWLKFYKPYIQLKDVTIPALTETQKVPVKCIGLKAKFTKPPSRFNPGSLLAAMEKQGIGTKATRAATIQTLYDRRYVGGSDSLMVTPLGFEVIEILSKYCTTVISPEMTRNLEEKMNAIQQGNETKDSVLQNAIATVKPVIEALKENQEIIGRQLAKALQKTWLEERIIAPCPKCKDGKLVIVFSKKAEKRFLGCTNFLSGLCNATYPLPQAGAIKPLAITCKSCGLPIVVAVLKGKKPWKFCLNPSCPLKDKRKYA